MNSMFDTDFEKVIYAVLVDCAAKTLNSEEIAPLFKSKTAEERKIIKRKILRELEVKVKKIGKELTEKSLSDPQMITFHQKEVREIISDIFRG